MCIYIIILIQRLCVTKAAGAKRHQSRIFHISKLHLLILLSLNQSSKRADPTLLSYQCPPLVHHSVLGGLVITLELLNQFKAQQEKMQQDNAAPISPMEKGCAGKLTTLCAKNDCT